MEAQGAFQEQNFGRYRLLSRIGEGGMAEVFKAKSFGVEGFEKIVAIKRILPRLSRYKSFVDMFVREAKVAVRLSHANVVQVFDLGRVEVPESDAPAYYMAMEYVAGLDLATLLLRARRVGIQPPRGLAVYVAAEVAKGLDHAHRRRDDSNQPLGLVHRDVSPQNILISWEGEVKVTDFGIAKARDSLSADDDDSRVRLVKGKFSYMSPEQARGEVVDHRCDLFSLGTVLYEVLSGANPFRDAQPLETLRRVREAEWPPLSLVAPELPAELVALIDRAMAPRPEGRFEDAARMYEALLAYSYRSGGRFGATEFLDFLQQVRAAPEVDAPESQESTPARVKTPPPSLASDENRDSEPVGLLKEVTVLCVRAPKGSGRMGEAGAATADACRRLGGRVVSDGGDEVVAIFGLGEADPRDAEYAARAAVAALRASDGAGLGAGVQAGRVRVDPEGALVVGVSEEALIDEARQLAVTARNEVLLSPEAARHVRVAFSLEERGMVFALGAPRPAQEAYGKFVGRRGELARLGTVLGSASKRQLQIITLVGSAGVGKTRLLHEVDRRLRRGDFNVGVYMAPCSPCGREMPLSGVGAMLQVLCGVQEGDGVDRARRVAPSLRALGLLDDEVDAVLSQLGVPSAHSEGPQVLRSAFLKTLMSLAEDRVHVFAWDNAHWLDEASGALLASSLRRLGPTRVALAFVGREGFVCPIDKARTIEHFELDDLPEDDALRLMATRLGVASLPPQLVEFCLRRAGGHPLFLEELLQELLDAGAVAVAAGEVRHLDLSAAPSMPRPLLTVMAGRVSRLPPEEQAALQVAAVIGEVFEGEAAIEVAGPEAREALRSLERREILRAASEGDFAFSSPLLRDVVLESLPRDALARLHGRAAEALERQGALLERVAEHLQEAGDLHGAGVLWARSTRRRAEARQFEAAVSEGLKALERLDLDRYDPGELLLLARALASALDRVRLARDARRLLLHAIERCPPGATAEQRAELSVEVASALGAVSCFDDALGVLSGVAREGLSPALVQRLLAAEAELHFRRGHFERSRQVTSAISRDQLPPELLPRVLGLQIQCHGFAAERMQALEDLVRLEQLSTPGDPVPAAHAEKLRALVLFFCRDFEQSAAASWRGAELARQAGLAYEEALHLHNLGDALFFADEHPRAYAAFQQSLWLCEQHGASRLALLNRMYLGYLDALQGLPGGETLLRDGVAHAEENGFLWDALNGRHLLGRLLADVGFLRAASAEFEACRSAALKLGHRLIADECSAMISRIQAQL